MNKPLAISHIWLKSSIIGTIWASSEIVLGSFLHNLRIPFSGSLLTAIALIILISASYTWTDKGLFWRSGIICALMKSMSPSAIIFGPMIAIFAESMLLEISVRMLGRTYLGFITGSILASMWTFFQKIINLLIFYGFNIVELYKNLMMYAEKMLNLTFDAVWTPIIILLAVYVILGIASAIVGIITGKRIKSYPVQYIPKNYDNADLLNQKAGKAGHHYSLIWLLMNIVLLILAFITLSFTFWPVWVIVSTIVITLWVWRYKRALRQLSRPRFWITFAMITMLAALVFSKLQSKSLAEALLIGLEMNMRATLLILGFSVLGTELYNPRIRKIFTKTRFRQLFDALELSANSLPMVVANTPDVKTALRNPSLVISQLIAYAEYRLTELSLPGGKPIKVIAVTGNIDSGKTALIKNLVSRLEQKGIKAGGIYSQKILDNGERSGYDVVDIQSGKAEKFLRLTNCAGSERIGKYFICSEGYQLGLQALKHGYNIHQKVMIIDEIGKLELAGKGWAQNFSELLHSRVECLLFTSRTEFLHEIIDKWQIRDCLIYDLSEKPASSIEEEIIGYLYPDDNPAWKSSR